MKEMDLVDVSQRRILIIDDEKFIRRSLADFLTEWGYLTTTAQDGAQGLAKARAESFHTVLVDLCMPHMDGLEVIAALKNEQPDLPVVVISGTGVLSDAVEAMRRGAWDYIAKPIQSIDEVVVVIERVLEKAHLRAERDRYQRELEQLNRSLEAEVARQTQDLRAQNRELAALNRVSYTISDPLDLDTMLHRGVDAAVVAIEVDSGAVRLFNPETKQLAIAAARGLPESYLALAQTIPLGQGVIGQVAQSGHPHVGHDFADDPWLASLSSPQAGGFGSYMCVPLRAGDTIVGTLEVATQDGRGFEAHEIELLAAIGNQIGVAVARIQYAADLETANVKLERAIAEMRRLDMLREQFIQNVAHELRTPLGLVHGYVEMLVQGDLGPDERKMALDVISRRVQALVGLVESITTLQDLDSQPLRYERIKLIELIQTALKMVSQRALSAGIELQSVCPTGLPAFSGDFTRLVQALHQVLDNACKFSSNSGTVSVTAQMTPDAVLILITDQGIGIPPEELPYVFERFYQVDGSTRRRYGGTGLGLAIAREIIGAHGGRVTVESVVDQGSTFTIQLPRGPSE